MKFRPLHDRVLIKRIEEQETVRGGIIIPDTAKEKPQEGEVVAAGTGKRLENGTVTPLEVKEGDRVLFGKYSGTEIKLDGNEYLIQREDEILVALSLHHPSRRAFHRSPLTDMRRPTGASGRIVPEDDLPFLRRRADAGRHRRPAQPR